MDIKNSTKKAGIITLYVFIILFLFLSKLMGADPSSSIAIAAILFAALTSVSIYWYLQTESFSNASLERNEKNRKESAFELMNEIKCAIDSYSLELRENVLTKSELKQIDTYIYKRIVELNNDGFSFDYSQDTLTQPVMLSLFLQFLDKEIKKLENALKIQNDIRQANTPSNHEHIDTLKKLIEQTTQRINSEIQLERRRSTIYIIFGSVITTIAGYVLYTSVQHMILTQEMTGDINIQSMIIRFSIVIFIEIFAFYYLRLYSKISDNIKFYQNEMTNVEMKSLCFYALKTEEVTNEAKGAILIELSKTERNFVIDKNKTTVDLERSKLDSNIIKSTISEIAKITRNFKN